LKIKKSLKSTYPEIINTPLESILNSNIQFSKKHYPQVQLISYDQLISSENALFSSKTSAFRLQFTLRMLFTANTANTMIEGKLARPNDVTHDRRRRNNDNDDYKIMIIIIYVLEELYRYNHRLVTYRYKHCCRPMRRRQGRFGRFIFRSCTYTVHTGARDSLSCRARIRDRVFYPPSYERKHTHTHTLLYYACNIIIIIIIIFRVVTALSSARQLN